MFCALSPISFFSFSIIIFYFFIFIKQLKGIICTQLLCDKNEGHHARLKDKNIYFAIELSLKEISLVV